MNFWPFNRPPPSLRVRQLRREVDQVNIDLVEVREDIEKILAAVKRIQGKTYRRKRADMEAVQLEAAPDGGEPSLQPVAPDGAPPQLHTVPFNPKQELRRRAAQLRGR